MMSFKKTLIRNLQNIPGWKTKRKILVIESDDWGTIRVSSKNAFNFFLNKDYPVDICPYNSYDSLESNEDLELLFNVLSSVKDKYNNPAIITANNVVANPDFKKIRESNYEKYFYEPFTETLKRYPDHDRVYELYKKGIIEKIFHPQFHGREHINLYRWMKDLQNNDETAKLAFDHEMFSVRVVPKIPYQDEYLDAFGSSENLNEHKQIISEGLDLFKELWGFNSCSFIAPCYVWHHGVEESTKMKGVEYIQGVRVQLLPINYLEKYRSKKNHYNGQKNKYNQRYLIRNAFFEPSINPNYDFAEDCLRRISAAFKWNNPAIICTHRLNYMGSLNPEKRNSNLKILSKLLKKITQLWPDVEFMSSDRLGDLMVNNN